MTAATLTAPAVAEPRRGSFRPDIQGLRAVAVLLVVLYHAGVPFLPGGFVGVDVFFVISGYLITGLLLRELREHGRIALADFYARRARRILPAAGATLLAVVAATLVLLPPTRWQDTLEHVGGAAVYVVNWLFASSAVDYLAGGDAASPVQHFWSLAVEEQFYLVWPVLLVAGAVVAGRGVGRARRRALPVTRVAAVALAVIAVPSFLFSVYYTAANPGAAYFVTTTRLWELGIGAGVAVAAASWRRIPAAAASTLTWAGVGAIVASGVLITGETAFPSYTALLPTLGAAAVIVGGVSAGRAGAGVVLSRRPMTFIGDISYSLYLWHWPLVAVGTYVLGGLTVVSGLALVAVSFVPAYLSYRYIEQPVMRAPLFKRSVRNSLVLGAAITVATGLVAVVGLVLIPKAEPLPTALPTQVDSSGQAERVLIGAELLAAGRTTGAPVDRVESMVPEPLAAADDNAQVYADGCHQPVGSVEPAACVYGDADADFTVALVGDSHAAHWVPPLQQLATDRAWRLETYTKSSCPLGAAPILNGDVPYEECVTWNANVRELLTEQRRPDVIVTSNYTVYTPVVDGETLDGEAAERALAAGLGESVRAAAAAGVPVVVLVDVPAVGINVPECVSDNHTSLTDCAVPRSEALAGSGAIENGAARGVDGVTVIDMNDLICPTETCAAVIGGVVVYRDAHHLTATYARTLAAPLWERVGELAAFSAAP